MYRIANVLACAVTFIALFGVQTSQAAPIVLQPFTGEPGEASSNSDGSFFGIAADNFVPNAPVSGGTTVTLTWWGRYFLGDQPSTSDFEVRLHTNTASGGASVEDDVPTHPSFFTTGIFTPTPTSVGGGNFSYSHTFAAPALAINTIYWISIFQTTTEDEWLWLEGSNDNLHSINNIATDPAFNGTWGNLGSPDFLAFELSTVESNVVPEPTSLALLGMGAMGFMGYGWRRRKHGSESAEV